jgi:hypothetical protein
MRLFFYGESFSFADQSVVIFLGGGCGCGGKPVIYEDTTVKGRAIFGGAPVRWEAWAVTWGSRQRPWVRKGREWRIFRRGGR